MKTVAAFDFDNTVTDRDAFVPFLVHTFGRVRVVKAFIRLLPEAIRVWRKKSTRDDFKEKIVALLFTDKPTLEVAVGIPAFASEVMQWIKPEARERLQWHKEQGHRLVLVSASLEIYLSPIAQQLGFDDLLATRLVVEGDRYIGELQGKNCRAAEKVERLCELLGDLDEVELYAYGDSEGDNEMLAAARYSFYRKFA